MSAALVPAEAAQLAELESVIERGAMMFVEVGGALAKIRDAGLYRPHQTFEDYCRERWGFTDRRARYLIDAAEIGTMVPVKNERQARELAPLRNEPEAAREAWAEASVNGTPTAAKVREVVQRTPPTVRAEVPQVVRAIQALYEATTTTPMEEVVAWQGNARSLAAQWAFAQSYANDVFDARGQHVPHVLKGEVISGSKETG